MPIYDYKCNQCGREWETMTLSVKESEELEKTLKCPSCGSGDKERQVAKSTSFQLKGKGWAKDRYGR